MTCIRCQEARRAVIASAGATLRGDLRSAAREAAKVGTAVSAKMQDEAARVRAMLNRR